MIWNSKPEVSVMQSFGKASLPGHLGIEITEIGDDFIKGTMPVDERTKQPMGLLHGGASAALAETLGSIASFLCINPEQSSGIAGTELNITHLRSATSGVVTGIARPVKIGRNLHTWDIRITDESGKDIAISRLTCMVLK